MREYDLIAVLEGRHPAPPLPDLQMIVQGDLTAVLSAFPRPVLRPAQSLDQHLQAAAWHLARQTACMGLSPLLPVRLDTPLTRAGAARFLAANHPFLDPLLTRYAGMAQVQITVSWHEAAVSSRFGHEAELATALADGAPSAQSMAQALALAVQQMALRVSAMIGADLATLATRIVPLGLAPGLVWSGIVLVPLRRLTELNRVLDKVTALWPEGLQVRQLGPDPVTSFATLDLSPVTPRQIDQALTAFGLVAPAEPGRLALARRRKLVEANRFPDPALRAEISDQAEILAAAARLFAARLNGPRRNGSGDGFALCRIWAEGSLTAPPHRAVA